MKKFASICLMFCILAPQVVLADDPILQRQDLMENTKKALGQMIGMVKGEQEFDAGQVLASLETMQKTANEAGALFPAGSETGHDTEAKSDIWSDPEGFQQALANFDAAVKAATAAAPASVDELKPVLNDVLKTCKGCHDTYRVQKEE